MENNITLSKYFDTVFGCAKSDKGTYHSYIKNYYTNIFTDLRDSHIKLLEIGVLDGKSIKFWNDWFTDAEIIGMDVDTKAKPFIDANRFNVIWGDAYTPKSVSMFEDEYFDFIIDDGPHTLVTQLYSSVNYFSKLKVGGLFIIEDIFDFDYVHEIEQNLKKNIKSNEYQFTCYDFREKLGRFDDVILEIKRLK